MNKGTTSTGFEYEVSEHIADDYELIEILNEIETNPFAVAKVVNYVLGKEQASALKEHCRVDGHVSSERINSEISEILNGNNELKK